MAANPLEALQALLDGESSERPSEFIGQQLAAMQPRKGAPEFGGADIERAAGFGMSARGGQAVREAPREIEDALYNYSAGLTTARETQRFLKSRGWQVDMRRGRGGFEGYDPEGNHYYIQP